MAQNLHVNFLKPERFFWDVFLISTVCLVIVGSAIKKKELCPSTARMGFFKSTMQSSHHCKQSVNTLLSRMMYILHNS